MAKFVIYAGVCSVGSDSLGPMACSLPRFSTHGIFQARMLEWVAKPSSRGSSSPRNQTRVSYVSCTGRRVFTTSATWERYYKIHPFFSVCLKILLLKKCKIFIVHSTYSENV